MLQLLLAEEDYEVNTAPTVESALEIASARQFDLFVLDKRLPDGSGLELCEKLTSISPGVPCIFYTGDAYEIHRQQAIEAGASAFVPKPHIDTLIDVVHKLLAERECAAAT
jgi:two-component system response regulator ResD